MCKVRESCNRFQSNSPSNQEPCGFGGSLGLMKLRAAAGGSLLIKFVQVVGEQPAGAGGYAKVWADSPTSQGISRGWNSQAGHRR